MHDYTEIINSISKNFGSVIKSAKQKSNITVDELAEKIDISVRYLYRIENEGIVPTFPIVCKLIRELALLPDSIFYPEKAVGRIRENLIRMLYQCDERSPEVVKATVNALIEKADEKELIHS